MFKDIDVTPEEEDEMIRKAAERIHRYGMEVAAIMLLEIVKPLVYIGGQLGRFFLYPIIPFFGEGASQTSEKFFTVFEKRENIDKLLALLEEKAREKEEEAQPKKGWRRFLPL